MISKSQEETDLIDPFGLLAEVICELGAPRFAPFETWALAAA